MPEIQPITASPSGYVDLQGRVAIVTGAARGLGQVIAEILACHGARLALVDIRPAIKTADIVLKAGGESIVLERDATRRDQALEAVETVISAWGRIDVLVNNAGVGGRIGLDDVVDDVFDRQIGVNLKAAMYWTQAAAPVMRRQGGGKIVNVSSISARVGGVDSSNPTSGAGRSGPVYAAAKGGVIAFTRWAARDLGPSGILVNALCPGPTATDATHGFTYDLHGVPIQHLGDPRDVAYAVLFFASQMSNHITGQTLNVDGGMRMD